MERIRPQVSVDVDDVNRAEDEEKVEGGGSTGHVI